MNESVQNLGFLLSQIGAYIGLEFRAALQALGISSGHAGILRLVSLSSKISQKELADKLSMNPSRLVILLDELEKIQLIVRAVDKVDRRSHNISLTKAGDEMVKKVGVISRKLTNNLCGGLSAKEKENLATLLHKIAVDQKLAPNVHPAYKAGLE